MTAVRRETGVELHNRNTKPISVILRFAPVRFVSCACILRAALAPALVDDFVDDFVAFFGAADAARHAGSTPAADRVDVQPCGSTISRIILIIQADQVWRRGPSMGRVPHNV